MYGVFNYYPTIVHARASLAFPEPPEKLQTAIVKLFRRLNAKMEERPDTIDYGADTLVCHYEIGVADGYCFNFLDEGEEGKLLKAVEKKPLPLLDFLVRVTYTLAHGQAKHGSFKSDFHLARLDFRRSESVVFTVCHDKGSKWLPLDVLIRNLIEKINIQLDAEGLGRLETLGLWGR